MPVRYQHRDKLTYESGKRQYTPGEGFRHGQKRKDKPEYMNHDCDRCGEDASYLSYRCTTCGADLTGDN